MTKKTDDKIYHVLTSIDTTLKQQASGRRIFMQGLLRGLGTALGATVLLAIVTSLAIQFFDVLDWSAFARYFFSEAVSE